MTDNNCCGDCSSCGGCGQSDDEVHAEFSEEAKAAITIYEAFMQEYDIPADLSAEELVQARMQTIYSEGGKCEDEECEEIHESPIDVFMQKLIVAARKKKDLKDEDLKYIANIVSSLDEAIYRDFVRITSEMQSGIVQDEDFDDVEEDNSKAKIDDSKSIPSPFQEN